MAKKMWFIGENGYRRSSPDAYINYVECVKNKDSKNVQQCLIDSVYNSKTKNPNDMNRGKALMQRLGLIKDWTTLTKYGEELVSEQKWEFKLMTQVEFTFLKGLIYYTKVNDQNNFSILKSIFSTLIDAYENNYSLTLEKCLIKAQPPIINSLNWGDVLNPEVFALGFCKNLNAGEKKIKCQNYWANYISLISKINKEGLTKNNKKRLIDNINKYRFLIDPKKATHEQFLLIDDFWSEGKKYKPLQLQDWANGLKEDNFLTIYKREVLNSIINNHHRFYSSRDNADITWRNLRLLPFFDFSSKTVTLNPNYYSLIKKMVKNWELIEKRVNPQKDFNFNSFLSILSNKDFEISKQNIKEIIHSKIGIKNIDDFLSLFTNYEQSKTKIRNKLKTINYNTDIEFYVYFEYFVGLKIIHLSNYQLNESIFNLKLDSFLKPFSHAPGGKPDIFGTFNNKTFMVEVTLLKGRSQNKNEAEPVKNHYSKVNPDHCYFIAPTIDKNTINDLHSGYRISDDYFVETKDIECFKIEDFIKLNQISQLFNHSKKGQFGYPFKTWISLFLILLLFILYFFLNFL